MFRFATLTVCVVVCSFSNIATAADPEPGLRVFYSGHSFHMFVPGRMGQFAKSAEIKEYQQAGTSSIGGSRVIQHWDKADDMNTAKKALMEGKVDVFTMAPHLKIPDEGIDKFVELGLKHNAKMRFLVQESWFPYDYFEKRVAKNDQRDETNFEQLRADQKKWRDLIEAQVKELNEKNKRQVVHIIPVGDAVIALREKVAAGKVPGITKQSELFSDPIGHGKVAIQLLAAYCNYACITGRSPVGLKINDKDVSAELNTLLQQIAWDTVTGYAYSGVKEKK